MGHWAAHGRRCTDRCRGGEGFQVDDSENPFKAVLIQYAEISDPTAIESNDLMQPTEFALYQNYPNPFNPTTTIKYEIPDQARNDNKHVTLRVYDILGREVVTLVDKQQKAGYYEVEWNAANNSSGVYFYRLETNTGFSQTKKMLLLR